MQRPTQVADTKRFISFRFPAHSQLLRVLFGLGVVVLAAGLSGTEIASRAAGFAQGNADDGLDQAQALLQQRKFEDALKAFKRANKQRNGKSVLCLWGIAQAYIGLDAHRDVVKICDQILQLVPQDEVERARAHNMRGVSLLALAGEKDRKKWSEAEAEFRKVLALAHDMPVAQFNLGIALLRQERDAEGIEALHAYLERAPRGPNAADARKMIENPRRAREPYAPAFSFTSEQGEFISLEESQGKVVLLDFWGTWCPPCVASVPELRSLHNRYSERPFLMLAISSDGDVDKWRRFVEKEKMVWPQYLDRDRRIHRMFRVNSFPTYVLLDHEGIIRFRSSGSSWMTSANMEDSIKKLLKAVEKLER